MDEPDTTLNKQENWWDFCPGCGSKLLFARTTSVAISFVCPNHKCGYFQSCSEFDR